MADIFWGILIIAIGLVDGESLFLGARSFWILFDFAGMFFIGRGVYRLLKGRSQA